MLQRINFIFEFDIELVHIEFVWLKCLVLM
jgi:hypothetical protein